MRLLRTSIIVGIGIYFGYRIAFESHFLLKVWLLMRILLMLLFPVFGSPME